MDQLVSLAPIGGLAIVVVGIVWMTSFLPHLKGLRVFIANASLFGYVALPEVLSYFLTVDWAEFLPEHQARYIIMAVTVMNIVMRVKMTTTPFGKSTLDSAP